MKIRTDFVTNSSSSSFVAITIKNKKLVEIFSSMQEIEGLEISSETNEIKYSLNEGWEIGQPPRSMKYFSKKLIALLRDLECENGNLKCTAAKKALKSFEAEIIEATEEVDWVHRMEGYGEAYSWEGFEDTVCKLMERKGLSSYPKFVTVNRHYTFDKEKGEKYKNDTKYEE